MVKFLIRLAINAVALGLAVYLVQGLAFTGDALGFVIVAIVFGLVNALIKPVVRLFTLPITVVTLGLFSLVINAFMLLLTGWLTEPLEVSGFFPALWGGIIISIVSTVLNRFVRD